MASAKDIRRRIRTVKNIQQITQAMKLVASARLQKAQLRVQAARPYAQKIQQLMADLAMSGTSIDHPLMQVRPEHTVALIVIGADRGMAGSYHANVIRLTEQFLRTHGPEHVRMFGMGKKGVAAMHKLACQPEEEIALPGLDVDFTTVRPLSGKVQQLFSDEAVDAVYLIYTRYISAMTQRTVSQRLLPLAAPATPPPGEERPSDYEFEPKPEELLGHLLGRYVDTLIYSAVLESIASEQGARMTSMTSATKNAGEMIDRLTLSLNRARQAAITTEISEIVSTAEALK